MRKITIIILSIFIILCSTGCTNNDNTTLCSDDYEAVGYVIINDNAYEFYKWSIGDSTAIFYLIPNTYRAEYGNKYIKYIRATNYTLYFYQE